MLHDDEKFLEVNPAAVRILGLNRAEIIGKHPAEFAAPMQPNGESPKCWRARHIERVHEERRGAVRVGLRAARRAKRFPWK